MAEDKKQNQGEKQEFIKFNESRTGQREYQNASEPKEGTQEIIRSREDNSHKN